MRFQAVIQSSGKTAAGIQVPAAVVAALGPSRKPAVRVTINGFTYRSTVATMGGVFMVGVSNENRALAGVAAGDTVDVDMELDTEPRVVTVPPDLQAAIDADADAQRNFEGLSYSRKLWYVLQVTDARTDETRQRRIAKSVASLHDGGA